MKYHLGLVDLPVVGPDPSSDDFVTQLYESRRLKNVLPPIGSETWGFEVELYLRGLKGQDLGVQTLLGTWFADIGGQHHTVYGDYLRQTPFPRQKYHLVHDVSVGPTKWRTVEVRSPVFSSGRLMRAALRALMRYLQKAAKVRILPTCGIHIHMGTLSDAMATRLSDCILSHPVRQEIIDFLLQSERRQTLFEYAYPGNGGGGRTRYAEVNLQSIRDHGTVEYRALGATTPWDVIDRMLTQVLIPCRKKIV